MVMGRGGTVIAAAFCGHICPVFAAWLFYSCAVFERLAGVYSGGQFGVVAAGNPKATDPLRFFQGIPELIFC